MIAILAILLGLAVVALIASISLSSFRPIEKGLRVSLCLTAAGLTWAGPSRLFGYPPGFGDLLMLVGLAITVWLVGYRYPRRSNLN